jgi:FKBP-type peptidyl-prolyl cis-trans isomerase FklB
LVVGLALAGCRSPASGPPALETPEDRFSYGLGARLGVDIRKSQHEVDRDLLLRGLDDGLAGDSALSEQEIAAALEEGVTRQRERQMALREQAARAALQESEAFLARNRERPGVVELESGVQYEVLEEGSGPVPGTEDFVSCHYRASLVDGTVVDDTTSLGRPRNFAVTAVVDGLEQALLRMPTGSRWKIYVPPQLAYGQRGGGSKVPPNSVLVFDVDLVSIGAAPGGGHGSH